MKTSEIQSALFGYADSVGRMKNGHIIVRRGFFYKHGMDSSIFADKVIKTLQKKGIPAQLINHYEQWKPFRGGDSVAKGSHFGVELVIDEQ